MGPRSWGTHLGKGGFSSHPQPRKEVRHALQSLPVGTVADVLTLHLTADESGIAKNLQVRGYGGLSEGKVVHNGSGKA
jgi:hypothetical protein